MSSIITLPSAIASRDFLVTECDNHGVTVTADYRTSVTMRAVAQACCDGFHDCPNITHLSCWECCEDMRVAGNGERA